MSESETSTAGWFRLKGWGFGGFTGGKLVETRLVTNVPIELAVEKLRGFIADRDAKILKTSENHLKLEVADTPAPSKKGAETRPVPYLIDLRLSQDHIEKSNTAGFASGSYVHTFIDVTLQPKRDRDRTKSQVTERARLLLGSLKSYLMAKELDGDADPTTPTVADEPAAETAEAADA